MTTIEITIDPIERKAYIWRTGRPNFDCQTLRWAQSFGYHLTDSSWRRLWNYLYYQNEAATCGSNRVGLPIESRLRVDRCAIMFTETTGD